MSTASYAASSSSGVESLWTLVKDLNRAKHNKEALDDAIDEEEALIGLLHSLDESIADASSRRGTAASSAAASSTTSRPPSSSPVFHQLAALHLIDKETQRIYDEINVLQQKQRDETLELHDARRTSVSLGLQMRQLSLFPTAGVANEAVALADAVEQKRKSCLKWLQEEEALSKRVAEVRLQNEALEAECRSLEEESGKAEVRAALVKEIARLEAAVDTLVKLVSIAPSPVRISRR